MTSQSSRRRGTAGLTIGALIEGYGLALAALATVTSCSVGASDPPTAAASAGPGEPVRMQLAWFPNAPNGGWTAAATEGYYQEAGLGPVTLQPGEPNVSPVQIRL